MNLPLSTAFTESHRFWVVLFSFSFISMHILISSVICWLFRSVLFSLHMFVFLIVFFSCSWHLILLHCDQKSPLLFLYISLLIRISNFWQDAGDLLNVLIVFCFSQCLQVYFDSQFNFVQILLLFLDLYLSFVSTAFIQELIQNWFWDINFLVF